MSEPSGELCIYRHLENGIHEFIFTKSSRAAVDEWMRHLERISEQYGSQNPVDLRMSLVDVRQSGILPLNYFFKRWQEWSKQHPTPAGMKGRVVGLHDANEFVVGLVQSFANLFSSNTQVAFFSSDKREDAIAWLLKESVVPSQP